MAIMRTLKQLLQIALLFLLLWSACVTPLSVLVASDEAANEGVAGDGGEVGLVGDDASQDASDAVLLPAAGVSSVYYFPKNSERLVPAGGLSEVLVGLSNTGDENLKITAISASLHLPFDHRLIVQNLTTQEFVNATVAPGIQATFSYPFTVSKFLQPGGLSLVASIYYEINDDIHRTVFYNGTVEITEGSGFFSGETLFLVTLGLGLLGLFAMWVRGQLQRFSKTRRTKTVETGTKNMDAINNEWLQGTAFAQMSKTPSQQMKTKKKK